MYQGSPTHIANLAAARDRSIAARPDHKAIRIAAYDSAPNLCRECHEPLSYEKRINKFCGSSCAAKVTNRNRVQSDETRAKRSASLKVTRARTEAVTCAFCGCDYIPRNRKRKKYCTADCGRNAVTALMASVEHRNTLAEKGRAGVAAQMAAGTWKGWAARNGPSYAEAYVQQQLRLQGFSFDTEYPVGRFSLDIAFPGLLVAIEVDGKQHREPKQRKHDVARDAILVERGWSVIRITWYSVKHATGLAKVTNQIAAAVTELNRRQATTAGQ